MNCKMNQISEQEIRKMYLEKKMSLGEIAEKYDFKSRTPIRNLLKKYNIEIRSKEESTSIRNLKLNDDRKLSKELLEQELLKNSVSKIGEKYNIHRSMISKWIKEYNLDIGYFKHIHLRDELLKNENIRLSAKQLALKYNVSITTIKKYKKEFHNNFYSIEEIKQKIIEYNYDLNNNGLVKQIKFDDENLYNSIFEHTKNHKLQSNKFTERLYRILNNIEENIVFLCSNCNTNKLKFYTFINGYGNSEYNLCEQCNNVLNGVSKISQKLFWEIYKELDDKTGCYFHELNYEKRFYIDENFIKQNKLSNKKYYKPDFVYKNKIIEFDGTFYHTNIEKEIIKDNFFSTIGKEIYHIIDKEYISNKQVTIQKCLDFLNQ